MNAIARNERFKNWKYPDIMEGKLTKYNWIVQHKDKLKLGYKTDIEAFTYIRGCPTIQNRAKKKGG
jgi:hypothetical protein